MKQLIVTFFTIAFFTTSAQASQLNNSKIRCSTNHNNGHFSIFVGTISEEGLSGYLSRGVNTNDGAGHATFEIIAPQTTSIDSGILTYQLSSDLFMPAPLDSIGWQTPTFTVGKSLLSILRGGMIEIGTLLLFNQSTLYRFEYKCIAL